jgi:hypothetical protein
MLTLKKQSVMNARKSAVLFALGIVWLGAVIWGFAHGVQQTEVGAKIAWIGGSLVFTALGVFLSYKLKK